MIVAQAAATAAPWWGAPTIATLATLGGGLLALIGSRWHLEREVRHRDLMRWDDLILETAVELIALTSKLAESGRVGYPGYIADADARTAQHIAVVEAINTATARFRFVASAPLLDSLHVLVAAAIHEELGLKDLRSSEDVRPFGEARAAFVDAVRMEIRTRPGNRRSGGRWPTRRKI